MYYVPTTDPRQAHWPARGNGAPLLKRPMQTYGMPPFYTAAYDQFKHGGNQKRMEARTMLPNPVLQYQNGQASKWVSAFKIGFSLLVAGSINAFLFGVPLWVAGTLSAGIASMQSMLALKIHKEDTEFSKNVVSTTRKWMGRTQDYTPSGKEWSMVPVWGGICGMLALVEATVNHGYRTIFTQEKNKPILEVLEARQNALQSLIKKHPASKLQVVYDLQLRGVKMTRAVLKQLREKVTQLAHSDGWKKRIGQTLETLWQGGRSMRVLYPLACGTAIMGGVLQTSIAAYMQGKVDQKNKLK